MINKDNIIAARVAARLQNQSVFNYPRSGAFDSAAFAKTYRGKRLDFTRKLRECEISGESFQGQILLAEHHIYEALTKIRYYQNQWYIKGEKSYFETDQDACRIIKNLDSSIFDRLSPAFIALDSADPLHTIRSEYKKLQRAFIVGLDSADVNYSTGKGKYAKRLFKYNPAAKEYLESTRNLCEKILEEAFKRQNNE